MKIVKVTLAILIWLLFLSAAAAASSAQYIAPQYGTGVAGNSAIYGAGTTAPLTSNMPSVTATVPSVPNAPAISSPNQAANLPAAEQYGNAAGALPAASPYAAAYGTPYAGLYGGPVGTGLTSCAAPLAAPLATPLVTPCAAPCAVPIAAPLAAVGPYSSGFTYAKQMSSAYGPFTPPVSQASEQYYQYPGVTPYGVYPGAGYAATGGVGYDPASGYYGPFGAYTPL
jgi:hypothetical protein